MKESLQEIIEEKPEDKELTELIKKIEDSYILKGLGWFEKKTKLKEYFPESKIAESFDSLRDLIVYGNIGLIPGEKQEKYTEYLGYDKLKFTKYSITYGFLLGGVKLGIAYLSNPVFFVSMSFSMMGAFTITDDLARLTYLLITKKPVGTSYVEIPYRLGKYFWKKEKEKRTDLKTQEKSKSLNSLKLLDLI